MEDREILSQALHAYNDFSLHEKVNQILTK